MSVPPTDRPDPQCGERRDSSAAIAVEVRGLAKRFGAQPIFEDLNLTVVRGERLAILGASGCGKSTLLRCIAGLETPDQGSITVDGSVGYVFQEPRLFPWLTVEENVAFAARNPIERARVDGLLMLVGLGTARRSLPKRLSGGMAQRAALARSLVQAPQLILLDEPLAALDALLRLELRTALRDIVVASGATSILVTHDVDEALGFADRCVVLTRGADGSEARTVVSAHDPAARTTIFAALGVLTPPARP